MNGDNDFDSLIVNGQPIVMGNAQCAGNSEPPVWSDTTNHACCYFIVMTVNSALLYSQECDEE